MSVNIATMGMFRDCCGGAPGGGGAPPYRRDEQIIKPTVMVKDVEMKTINSLEEIKSRIKAKLISVD